MQTHLNVSWGNTKLERQAGDKNRGDGHSALDRQRALLGLLTLLRQVTLEHGESWASHVGSAHQHVCAHAHTHTHTLPGTWEGSMAHPTSCFYPPHGRGFYERICLQKATRCQIFGNDLPLTFQAAPS